MGTQSGTSFTSLISELEQHAPEYNVFQAFYLAERTSKQFHPNRNDAHFEQTGLKFRPYEKYTYPPTDIRSFQLENHTMKFVLNFMGLYGVNAPLPRCYHEQVAEQQAVHGPGEVPLQNFLEIFNNRFYWLYYQAWKKYRHYLALNSQDQNRHSERILSFIGLGFDKSTEKPAPVSKYRLMRISSILSCRVKNKTGLRLALQEFFPKYTFHIKEFIPKMVKLSGLPSLGSNEKNPVQLGQNSVLGRSILDYQSKIAIEVGPMDFEDYLKFLPNGYRANLMKEVIDLYINEGLEYDLEFLIQTEHMDNVPWKNDQLRLGQSLWLGKPTAEIVRRQYSYEKFLAA